MTTQLEGGEEKEEEQKGREKGERDFTPKREEKALKPRRVMAWEDTIDDIFLEKDELAACEAQREYLQVSNILFKKIKSNSHFFFLEYSRKV